MKKSALFCFRGILVLLFVLASGSLCVRAEERADSFTATKIGDTVLTYGDDMRYSTRLYMFADEDSCAPCAQMLSDITHAVANRKDVQTIVFLRARGEAAAEHFREEYGLSFPVVFDAAMAYRKLYRVVRSPVLLLTDRRGVVTFIGNPGAAWSIPALLQALENRQNNKSTGESLTRVSQKVVHHSDGTPIDNWHAQFGTRVRGRDEFVIWDFMSKILLWVNGQGKILKYHYISEFPENHGMTVPRPIFFAGEASPDRIPFLNLNFIDITATMYNVHRNSFTLERLWDVPPPDSLHINPTAAFRLSDTTFLIPYLYSDRSVLRRYPDTYAAVIVDSAGKITSTIGRFEAYNVSRYVVNYLMQSFCTDDKGNIYMTETFSDTIRVYNPAGRHIRNIACDYDSTLWYYAWREDFEVLYEDSPVEEIMKPSDIITKVAGNNGLFYDVPGQQVYVVYQRKVITPSGNTWYRFFLHRPVEGGKKVRRDLALPGDAKPIHVENGLVYCTENLDGVLNITVYKIPDWL
jgi:peroxiredoxin